VDRQPYLREYVFLDVKVRATVENESEDAPGTVDWQVGSRQVAAVAASTVMTAHGAAWPVRPKLTLARFGG
jgi:hypothetical protein